ncbi:hypothetical protein C8N35_104212 [Breoghania corrubedonensis]|uniref:Fe2OG dioxygenase domain-containing protein n=1 Tax=Breoghania corrubedonensis TaxID=665038 RepID=A0A2T5VA07_9HYPH|nr:hypothetical protein [Breoghania corrubedonensis]PTW60587.1 hypothetical protein C8N35_104212 [Breoghania corrubedonensis]
MKNFETALNEHIALIPAQLTELLAERFRAESIVAMKHLVPMGIANILHEQALRVLAASAARREMELAVTGGTPRAYHSVGRDTIAAQRGPVTDFFESDALRAYLSRIAGEKLFKVPYAPEEYIINSQQRPGDTHGWHWDDYTFALIWMVEAPTPWEGGRVEYVPDTSWDKADPKGCLERTLKTREVRSRYFEAGTCYLMRANTTLHRVAPINCGTRRTVIVFTYASEADLCDPNISHETMEAIYAPEVEAAA